MHSLDCSNSERDISGRDPSRFASTGNLPTAHAEHIMSVDPAALDGLLVARGGFEAAYEKLLAAAKALLQTYGGDSGGRALLRQMDAADVVDAAFERLFDEGFPPGDDVYLLLRRHIQNNIRSVAKSAKEARTVRVDGNEDATRIYSQQSDPLEQSAPDRALITDDIEYGMKVLFRLTTAVKDDPQVVALATAIIEGYRDPDDICVVADLTKPQYDATFKRMKRKFAQILAASEEDKQ